MVQWHASTPLCSGIGETDDDYNAADDSTNRTFEACLPGRAAVSGSQLTFITLEPGQAIKVPVSALCSLCGFTDITRGDA